MVKMDNEERMLATMDVSDHEIDELVKMIDGKMDGGVSRLSVGFLKDQKADFVKERVSMGKRDAWDPWIWGEGYGSRDLDESF